MANGQAAEVGTIGNDGIVGLPLLLGDDRAPTSAYVQVPGGGLRMTAERVSVEFAHRAAMRKVKRLIGLKGKYDIAFACDADHERHGVVAPGVRLMQPNHFLSVAIDYMFRRRRDWRRKAAVGDRG